MDLPVQRVGDLCAEFPQEGVEDVIVKKMDFFRQGGSEKHLRDIAGILKISGDDLDREYIENWAENMGLETIWRTILHSVR
jgi:hypothetical protein